MTRAVENVFSPSSIHAVLELVRRDDAVPELMAGFVDRHVLGIVDVCCGASQDVPAVKSVGYSMPSAPLCHAGIDDRDVAVRVRTEPLAVVPERGARRGEVALLLARVLRLQQQPHVHRRQRRVLERRALLDVVRARRPREVVHVRLIEVMRARGVPDRRVTSRSTPVAPTIQPDGTVSRTS